LDEGAGLLMGSILPMPTIQIHQQPAKLGIEAKRATLDLEQPRATLDIQTTRPQLNIHSPRGDLRIDQSKAWDALGQGGTLQMLSRIYSESRNVGLEGIANIVEDGNKLAAIHTGGNAIADLGQYRAFENRAFNYLGEASFDNVDLEYIAHKADIQVTDGNVAIDVQVNRPINRSQQGKLDIYMLQYHKVEITPPQIDLKL